MWICKAWKKICEILVVHNVHTKIILYFTNYARSNFRLMSVGMILTPRLL
jgi:hypothetical protein